MAALPPPASHGLLGRLPRGTYASPAADARISSDGPISDTTDMATAASTTGIDPSAKGVPAWLGYLSALAVFVVFAAHGGWQVPDVNEAHYLTKARHYWEPDWAARDFFLNSADSHKVFFVTLGWLGTLVSFDAFAWIGRLLTWGLLAAAFYRLCASLRLRNWYAPLAAALFVALNSRFALAGEWVIGGFEAKGIAYAAVLWAIERFILKKWNQALIVLGVATAFHVLVGGWSAIALGFAWLRLGRDRPSLISLWTGLLVSAILALPALIFAVSLNWGVDADTIDRANRIYVFGRLAHHLLPSYFGEQAWLRIGLLWVVWGMLGWRLRNDQEISRLRGFVNGAVLIAIVGALIFLATRGNGSLNAAWMRYYWFRLADFALPLGVALLAVHWAIRLNPGPTGRRILLSALTLVAAASLADDVQRHFHAEQAPSDSPRRVADYAAWRDVCRWARKNTSPDALFLTPRLTQTFKWFAERAEVVNLKDVPQDAINIVEWWQRLASVNRVLLPSGERLWLDSLTQQSPEKLRQIAKTYQVDYLITDCEPKLDLEQIYSNNSYAVYRLPHD